MSLSYQLTQIEAGEDNKNPRILLLNTNDTQAQVTAAGYINIQLAPGGTINNSDIIWANIANNAKLILNPTVVNGLCTLTISSSGNVTLPTVAGHIATYTDAIGTLSEDPATAICLGNIQSGANGDAGFFTSYSASSNTGSLSFKATANSGNYATVLTNSACGQATTFSLPDPGASTATVVASNNAASIQAGDLLVAANTTGVVQGAGFSIRTAEITYGGGVANPIFSDSQVSNLDSVWCSLVSSANPVTIQLVNAVTAGIQVTFSGNPGACRCQFLILHSHA